MTSWACFKDPRFDLLLEYPHFGTDGESVEQIDTGQGEVLRVHIRTPKSREIYFEISRYRTLPAGVEYHQHKENLKKRFPKLRMTGLTKTSLADLPAYHYSFEWEFGSRTVILVERCEALYRILFNPDHAINLQILASLRWLNRD